MNTTRNCVTLLIVAAAVLLAGGEGRAQAVEPPRLTAAEGSAIGNCLNIIRGCQLADGSFNMVADGKTASSPVWIAPYFVQHAALALLAANNFKKNPSDVLRVGKWLEWCAEHQDKGGFWYDQVGTIASYSSNGKVDAHDSSAAMFLLAAERYRHAGSKLSPRIISAAKASLSCISDVTDSDGLTWAKPDHHVKYLMDNVEVFAGLMAAQQLFESTANPHEAALASKQLATMKLPLQSFWEGSERDRFAWVLHPSGTFEGGLDQIYPDGLAQLFGISCIAVKSAAFSETCAAFAAETTREGVGAERFLIAASRVGSAETKTWRANVVKDAATFTPKTVYISRPSLVVLSLLEGADWMPSVVSLDIK